MAEHGRLSGAATKLAATQENISRMADPDSLFPDRFARRIDTRIAPPLGDMLNAGENPGLPAEITTLLKQLARRNLLRGYRLAAPTVEGERPWLRYPPPVPNRTTCRRSIPATTTSCASTVWPAARRRAFSG